MTLVRAHNRDTVPLKERQPSPQNLGRAACKLWGRRSPHILAYFKTNDSTKMTYNNNLDKWPTFQKRDYHHLTILGAPPVSCEGEGSPIIWPISETNHNTKTTYNNNLDKWPTFQKRDYHHLRILGAPPVSSEGEGSPIINLAYFKNKWHYKNNLQ